MRCKNQSELRLKAFLKNTRGTVAVEYGVIITAMFLAIIPRFLYVSTGIRIKFEALASYF